jgi:peptidoglycan/LPS O-acetylase OafA/YrhL
LRSASLPSARWPDSHAEQPGYCSIARDGETIAALDGLRAAAIFLVLGCHVMNPYRPLEGNGFGTMFDVFSWDAATPLINGWIGVDLFFILSGFLISTGIIRRSSTTGNSRFGRYIARRALRILQPITPCWPSLPPGRSHSMPSAKTLSALG